MYAPARQPNDLERLFVERVNSQDLEGLLALYEPNAVISDGSGNLAQGKTEIRAFLSDFLSKAPKLSPSNQSPALASRDIALTSSHLSNGDVTAEVARRQPDGTWLWVLDQFAL